MHTSAHDAAELASGSDIAEFDLGILDGIDLSPNNFLPAQAPYADRYFLFRPIANHAFFVEPEHFQLKIQSFKSGGYEGTVRLVNAQRIADLQNIPRRIGCLP